jgi:regulator of sigma E protease
MMIDILIKLFAFLLAIGVLVAVHEFGHFWVARKAGVKVLRFSLGFGKVLWRRQGAETEYVVSVLPLGGYVKMLGEQDTDVPEHEKHRAFSVQPIWKRSAIVVAGPLFNLIFAAIVYICIFLVGIPGTKPVVGETAPGSFAAQAGFEKNDLITAVGSEPVGNWEDTRLHLLKAALADDAFKVSVRTAEGSETERTFSFGESNLLESEGDILENIGLFPWQPDADLVIMEPQAGSPAERSGLRSGDHVAKADDHPIRSWSDWTRHVRSHPGVAVQLEILRNGQPVQLSIVPEEKKEEDGKTIGSIGAVVQLKPVNPDELKEMQLIVRYPLFESIAKGLTKTWDMTLFTFQIIGKLVVGEASLKNVSGPVTIADYAGKTLTLDYRIFLNFLAVISIGLAVLNILPIPMLDGGHLLYYAVELLIGKPLPERIQIMGQNIGIFLLACLMSLAFYNDIMRLMR